MIVTFERREWMGSGGPRGLQILPSGANPIRGGFDSHTFPPLFLARRSRRGSFRAAAVLLAAVSLASIAEPAAGAAKPPRRGPSPTRATLESLFVPGLGQVRSGNPIRGAFAFGLESYLVARAVVEARRARNDEDRAVAAATDAEAFEPEQLAAGHRESRDDFLFWTAIAHMYNLLDAYVAAHLSGVDDEIDEVQRITWQLEPRAGGGDLSVTWTF